MSLKLGYIILYVPSVPDALAFYEKAFGIETKFLHEGQDYGEAATEGVTLSFTSHELGAQAVPTTYRKSTPDDKPLGTELTLVTEDVDAAYQRAIDNGAVALKEPHDEPWGQRVSYVRDLNGFLIGIASPMG